MRKRQRHERAGRRLVEVLIARGAPPSIAARAEEFYQPRRLGEWLVAEGLITSQELACALAEQAAERGEYAAAGEHLQSVAQTVSRTRHELLDRLDVAIGAITRKATF